MLVHQDLVDKTQVKTLHFPFVTSTEEDALLKTVDSDNDNSDKIDDP